MKNQNIFLQKTLKLIIEQFSTLLPKYFWNREANFRFRATIVFCKQYRSSKFQVFWKYFITQNTKFLSLGRFLSTKIIFIFSWMLLIQRHPCQLCRQDSWCNGSILCNSCWEYEFHSHLPSLDLSTLLKGLTAYCNILLWNTYVHLQMTIFVHFWVSSQFHLSAWNQIIFSNYFIPIVLFLLHKRKHKRLNLLLNVHLFRE